MGMLDGITTSELVKELAKREDKPHVFEILEQVYDVFAGKVWVPEDISSMDTSLTDEDVGAIINILQDEDTLSDCTDAEWDAIQWAIDEYKDTKGRELI